MFTDQKINDAGMLQVCYVIVFIIVLLAQTFLYCAAGELVTGQVSYIFIQIRYK